jgi:tight adherence protein B
MLPGKEAAMALLIGLLTFLVVLMVFVGIWMITSGDKQREMIRRRIEAVRSAEKRGEVSADLKLVRDELYSNVPQLHRLLLRLPWSGGVQKFITQAGLKMKAGKVVLWTAVAGLGTYLVVGMFHPHETVIPILSGLLATAAPFGTVAFMRQRRLGQFEEHFPEALDLIGRAVRAGHAFTSGLEMVSKEASEPVAGEFRATFEEQNFGLPLRDALLNLTERVPLVDVQLFATALLVQKETGGNLAELLDELARLIRERFRIYREIKVRTAQGRLTAGILIALPIVMLIVMNFLNPDYVRVLFTDPIGPTVLLAAGLLQVVGSLIIWKIVHIEV